MRFTSNITLTYNLRKTDIYKEFWFVLCAPFPEQIFGNLQLIIKDLSSLILLAKTFEMLQLLFHVFN
jgi:hypothetical protein